MGPDELPSVERAIQLLAVLHLSVVGLSHVLAHRAWARYFERLSALGEEGAFVNGVLHFACGSIVIAFHTVWSGIPLVLTLIGYGTAFKGALYLCFPKLGLRSMARVTEARSARFIPAGALMLLIAAALI